MKLLTFLFLLLASSSHAQLLSGTLVEEGRKAITNIQFVQEGTANGYIIYELAVDREGNVTGLNLIESTINSTPTKVKVRNYLKTVKFEKGTHYPAFHHVRVKITMVVPV